MPQRSIFLPWAKAPVWSCKARLRGLKSDLIFLRFLTLLPILALSAALGCHRSQPTTPASTTPIQNVVSPSAPTSGASPFRDVAQEAGLNFRWGHGGRSPLTIIETLGHGTAFLDVDQDGLLDILLVGNRKLALYHNLGNGRFEEVTRKAGLTAEGDFYGVAVGDYDNDGYPDCYITGYGTCVLYHNRGRGATGFEDMTAKAGVGARGPYDCVTAAAFLDIDGDGKLDLFAGRYIRYTPKSIQFCMYQGVRAGCGVKNYDPDAPQIFRNNGDGTFTNRTKEWGFDKAHGRCLGVAVRATDNGKGAAIYLANDELPGDLFVPQGSKMVEIGVRSGVAYNHDGLTQGGMGTDWGDFLNEGKPGLAVTTFQSEADSLYQGEGSDLYREVGATFNIASATTGWVGWMVKFLDYDNDGWLDLLITNGHSQDNAHQVEADRSYPQPMLLYHNEAGNVFKEVRERSDPAFAQPFVGRGGSVGDFDNDGRLDVLLVDEEGAPKLLHNETASGANHWLMVRLVGTRCNRDGIGARVVVTANRRHYTRDLSLCGGYLSAHDPRLHFGLGPVDRIEKIEVRWPDGSVDTVSHQPTDRILTITQGKEVTRR